MSTNFRLLSHTSAKLFLKNLYAAIKLGHYHFGHYFQIIFNLYSYCTRFNSTHINYYILSILSTNFSLLLLTSAKLLTKNYIQQSNWVIFDHFGHYFQIIFNLYSYCTRFNSIHINYNILFILSTNFSLLLLTSAKLFLKNLYAAIKLGHYHFGHYFQIIFNLYSYCTRFNSISINYNILFILSINFRLLSLTSAKLLTKNLYTAIKLGHF